MNWYTADPHYGHAGVIEYCKRPFASVEIMNATLIRYWNGRVKPEDTVYLLGDASFYPASTGVTILKCLQGRKILVQGNHDQYSMQQYLDAGFAAVVQEAVIKIAGFRVRLSHFPYWPEGAEQFPKMLRYKDRRPIDDGGWLLCGHVHEAWKINGKQINVGVDQWGYAPVSQGQIESIIMLANREAK